MHTDSDDNSESQSFESSFISFLFFSCLWAHVCLSVCKNAVHFVPMKGWCVVEGPEVCYTLENGQAQSRIPDLSSSPSSLALCCHGMSPWVTVSLATGCLLRSRGDAERLVEGGKGGGGCDIGGNSHMSYKSKVNNFQPLLTKCLCPHSLPHPSR